MVSGLHSKLPRPLATAALAAAFLCLAPSPASAQTRDLSGRIIPRNPLQAAKDTLLSIEVHPLAKGVYAAKNRFVWNGWVELPEGILVIDGGYNARSAGALADTIRARSPGKPFRYLVVTSGHVEHLGGVRTFASLGATVLAHPTVAAALKDSIPAAPDAAGSKRAMGPVAEVKDSLVLGPPDRPVEIRWLGRAANSPGDIFVHLKKERVLFTGDLAWYRSVPWLVDAEFSYEGWIATLDTLLTRRFDADSLVPGHGRIAQRFQGLEYTKYYLLDAMLKAGRMAAWGIAPEAMEEQGYLGAYEEDEYYDPIHFYNMKRLHQLSKGIRTPGRAVPGMVVPR